MRTHPFPLPSLLLAGLLLGLAPCPARADGSAAPPANLPKPVSRRLQGGAPPGSATAPTAPGAPALAVARDVKGTGIAEVKTSEGVALTGGGSAVEFGVRFRVEGEAGRHFYLNAVFLDPATGQAVRAQRTAFADASTGALYVISQPVVHAGGTALYDAVLQVPYDAVPTPAAGTTSSLEARISLFRRALGGGMDESMDWTSAPFRVRGPAATPVVAPPAPSDPSLPPAGAPPAPAVGPSPAVVTAPAVVAAPTPPATAATPAASTAILEIVKNHNQAYPDGRLGLRLDVRYRVVGDAGRSFYLHGLFFDQATGSPVLSNRAAFADRTTGVLYVITQPGVHAGGTNEYRTSLWVPYDAFPRPAAGSVTPIEARVTLFRRDLGAGMDASMDVSGTTFKVHGE